MTVLCPTVGISLLLVTGVFCWCSAFGHRSVLLVQCFWSQECFVGAVFCLLEIQKEKKLTLIFQQDYLVKEGSNKSARMFIKK